MQNVIPAFAKAMAGRQNSKLKVGIIGAGVMGNVFVERLLTTRTVNKSQILVSRRCDDKKPLIDQCQILILAVKPQDFGELAQQYNKACRDIIQPLGRDSIRQLGRDFLSLPLRHTAHQKGAGMKPAPNKRSSAPNSASQHLIISIMAGIDIKTVQKSLNVKAVVRAMPNLPAKIGQGVTIWKPSSQVDQKQKDQSRKIFQSLGVEIEVKGEKMIDLSTAVSGSGAAYVFLFQELMIKAAQDLGLSKKIAAQLVSQTFYGAVNLQRQLGVDYKILREQVTSKGGTTEAAFQVFKERQLGKIFKKAMQSAFRRSQELKKLL